MLWAYLAIIAIVTALAVVSTWTGIKLLKDRGLSRQRKSVLMVLLVLGVLLGLYGSVGPVRVGAETAFAGFPLPWAVLAETPDGTWIDHPVYFGAVLFPPINFVFWVGLLVAPVNVVEGWRRWAKRRQGGL